jgi:hypothetical protein
MKIGDWHCPDRLLDREQNELAWKSVNVTYTEVLPGRWSPEMNSLSKRWCPSASSATTNGDAPAATLE